MHTPPIDSVSLEYLWVVSLALYLLLTEWSPDLRDLATCVSYTKK